MKARLLKILRQTKGVVSGQALSSRLGVSRVAVWKHIRKLQDLGYEIESGPKGYKLSRSPDEPFPWEFPERESKIHYFQQLTSTMDAARDMARKNCPDFSVVIAGIQTKGRGRMERIWHSSKGGLYFTVILRPLIPPFMATLVSFAASLVLVQTIRKCCHVDAWIKWPNDILVKGKKISGILSEMEASAEVVSFINIGIGININNKPPSDVPQASSLKAITGRAHSKKAFLSAYLDRLENRINHQHLETVLTDWKLHAATLGQEVNVVSRQGVISGKAVNVDESGALIIRDREGVLQKVFYGDCIHAGPVDVRRTEKQT